MCSTTHHQHMQFTSSLSCQKPKAHIAPSFPRYHISLPSNLQSKAKPKEQNQNQTSPSIFTPRGPNLNSFNTTHLLKHPHTTMGNCLFFNAQEPEHPKIQVSTSTGAIMEFNPPITVGHIVKEYPGHFIFKSHDVFWKPLCHHEALEPGQPYCLLKWAQRNVGHVRSRSIPSEASCKPYKMSFESRGVLKRSSSSRVSGSGVWKVKLVISPEQLVEILAQEGRTEELVENGRTVARCGVSRASSMDLSDQWSQSS